MKYIRKKIKGNKRYYYFEYPLFNIYAGQKLSFSKYIGLTIPKNIKELLKEFFETIADKSLNTINKKIRDYFSFDRLDGVKYIEKFRFWFHCLQHPLFKKELQLFQNLFYLLFVLNSNRAEGSRVTRPDIEKVLRKKIVKPKTEIDKEIINSIEAINFAFSKEMKWNIKSIKLIHQKLFHNLRPNIAGQYRTVPIIAGDGSIPTTPPKKIAKEMKQLMEWLFNQKKLKKYPPIIALEFHWRFEHIHPFYDGNGRVGRILLNAILVEKGFLPVICFSQNHRSYCSAIKKSIQGYNRKLTKYFIKQLRKTIRNVAEYQKKGVIHGGSKQIGQWEIGRGKIRVY